MGNLPFRKRSSEGDGNTLDKKTEMQPLLHKLNEEHETKNSQLPTCGWFGPCWQNQRCHPGR
jgi:hypothetical protein